MARLDGGTSIAGYTALHSGLPNAYLGGTLTVSGNVRIPGTAYLAIADDGAPIDASLHIKKSEPRFNRLTQMSPGTAVAADALNLIASRTSAGADQWWSWGVTSGSVFQIAPGTNLSSGTLNLTSGRVGVNTSAPRYQFDVNGDIIASNWVRTVGNNGWYSESWGGGWNMTDGTWIRAYNGKAILTTAYMQVGNTSNTALGGIGAGDTSVDYTPTTNNWTNGGTTLLLSALNYSTIGFHDAGTRVDFIRTGAGVMELGYNGGWGNASVRVPGTFVLPVGTDKFAT